MITFCPAAKPHGSVAQDNNGHLNVEVEANENQNGLDHIEEEEDPYNLCPEDIYDIVDGDSSLSPVVLNRPPAPLPRPASELEPEKQSTYISRGCFFYFTLNVPFAHFYKTILWAKVANVLFMTVFSDKSLSQHKTAEMEYPAGKVYFKLMEITLTIFELMSLVIAPWLKRLFSLPMEVLKLLLFVECQRFHPPSSTCSRSPNTYL